MDIIISNYDNNQSEVLSLFRKTGLLSKFDVVEGSVIFRLSPVKQELLELKCF
jgi:hypothetical protein